MYDTSEFRKGLKILMEDFPYLIIDFQHVKPGKGNQFTRTKLRNLITGSNVDKTFRSGEKVGVPDLEEKKMNFLYKEKDEFSIMDQTSYEQMTLGEKEVGETKYFLIEGTEVFILLFNNKVIAVDPPKSIVLTVTDTPPNFKGDTASGGSKPATMETGVVIQVPFHININDKLKINTKNKEYVERA